MAKWILSRFRELCRLCAGLDQSNVSRLRERVASADLARRFFDAIGTFARERDLLSAERPAQIHGRVNDPRAGCCCDGEQ